MDRRSFLKTGLASVPFAAALDFPAYAAEDRPLVVSPFPNAPPAPAAGAKPWQNDIRRIGQTNFTEHDPVELNVEAWADYWANLKTDVVFLSVTGILAFYPTQVKFHRKGKFLGDRDLFGECVTAAKKRGMRIVARMSPDLNWDDALAAHPEWAERDAHGAVKRNGDDDRLFRTCMFSSYMTDYMPQIMREVNARYDVDAYYTNGWPPIGALPECYCEACRKLPPAGTPAYWEKFNERVFFLWKMYDAIAKEKKADSFFFANLGGGVHAGPNLAQLGAFCPWFQADNQGRGNESSPIWGAALQGRVCNAVLDGNMAANVVGAYDTGAIRWRNASKSRAEAEMWLSESLATGMVPYYHFVGAEKGLGEDRRLLETGRDYFQWTARHDRDFRNRRTIANVGVLIGQRTQLFYRGPEGTKTDDSVNGIYMALLEGRFAWDFVHEDLLQPERLRKYRALILPNTALLSDAQCAQLRAYVEAGGSLLATFETGLFDERSVARQQSGLADVFGIHKVGDRVGTRGNPYYSRIEKSALDHALLSGFKDTNWLPGAEYRIPLAPVAAPLLTVVPGFPSYPPELAYPPVSQTDEPAVVLREKGTSRLAYFSGDVERTYWKTGNTDIGELLVNAIRWVTRDERPYAVTGDGLVETIAWETDGGYALHLLNYTNPQAFHGWLKTSCPLGALRVRVGVGAGRKVNGVELLRSERSVPFQQEADSVSFGIPRLDAYEVAAIRFA